VVREIYLFKWNEETGCLRKLLNDVCSLYFLTDVFPVMHEGEQMGRACNMCGRECSAFGCHRRHLSVVYYLLYNQLYGFRKSVLPV